MPSLAGAIRSILVVTILVVQYFSFSIGNPLDMVTEIALMFAVGYLALLLIEVAGREMSRSLRGRHAGPEYDRRTRA